jgi:hypothetical protein
MDFFNEEGRKAGRKRGNEMDGGSCGIPAFLLSLFKSFQRPRYSAARRLAVAMVLRWSLAVNSGWRL